MIGSFFCLTPTVEQRIGPTMSMKEFRVLLVFIVLAALAACPRQNRKNDRGIPR